VKAAPKEKTYLSGRLAGWRRIISWRLQLAAGCMAAQAGGLNGVALILAEIINRNENTVIKCRLNL